jgi:hypothetical protein
MSKLLVWQTDDGQVAKYSLAYINPRVCGLDHGGVLGYDNSHDHHYRHFMGTIEHIDFKSFEDLSRRFRSEVEEL